MSVDTSQNLNELEMISAVKVYLKYFIARALFYISWEPSECVERLVYVVSLPH